jgi:AmpD protein
MARAYSVTDNGVVDGARFIACDNCDERPEDSSIDLLVIHAISLPPGVFGGPAVIELFTNALDPQAHPYYESIAGLRVSAHLLIRRDGELLQFVPCDKRAWHAGASAWQGRTRCNDFSIGIELEGSDADLFEQVQYDVLAAVTRALRCRYPLRDIVGHADIAPGRKTDPGPRFDWPHYRAMIDSTGSVV